MKKLLFIAFLFGYLSPVVYGQSLDAYKKSAEQAYYDKDYPTAYVHAREVLEDEPENTIFLKIAAESGVEVCEFDEADQYFATIRRVDPEGNYPLMLFYMAKSQHRQGNYEEASHYYQEFLSYSDGRGVDPEIVSLVREKLQECESVWEDPLDIKITPLSDINTAYSEFSLPIFKGNTYFGKLTPSEKCECAKPCSDKMQLFQRNGTGYITPILFPKGFDDVGYITYANEGNRMYFTNCDCSSNQYTCAIYYRDKIGGTNEWSQPVKLPASINRPGYTATQPYFHETDGKGIGRLYYVSNYHQENAERTDLDIWFTDVQGNNCDVPVNLSTVNTKGDETTPFFHSTSHSLYFSSNGRQSLGGYDFDIFKYSFAGSASYECNEEQPESSQVVNIGEPINSIFDDLYFSMDEEGHKMLFSSNRKSPDYQSQIGELEHCCPDIFEASYEPKADILVSVQCKNCDEYSSPEKIDLSGLVLTGTDAAGKALEYELEGDKFRFKQLPLKQEFSFSAELTNYTGDSKATNSGECDGETVLLDLFLEPRITVTVDFRDFDDRESPVDVDQVIIKDLSTGTSSILKNDYGGSSNFTTQLCANRQYEITTNTTVVLTEEFSFCAVDERSFQVTTTCVAEDFTHTFQLYKSRNILEEPLPLYFWHAEPRPITSATLASGDYESYYEDYIKMEQEFNTESAKNPCSFNLEHKDTIENFFNEVEVNWNRMTAFAGDILTYLEPFTELDPNEITEKLTVTIRGVASAAGNNSRTYSNDNLSKRRIDSMRKYLKNYLDKYGKKDEYGRPYDYMRHIDVIPDAKGSTLATPGAPSTGECRKYDVRSSKDRRIEIMSIEFTPLDGSEDYAHPCEANTDGYSSKQ